MFEPAVLHDSDLGDALVWLGDRMKIRSARGE
jgi:hypothetical protein